MIDSAFLWAAVVVAFAGVVRGVTGFGGAMVIAPALSVSLSPERAVAIALTLEAFAALPLLRPAVRSVNWEVMRPIIISAFIAAPAGGFLLVSLDPVLMRRLIAIIVIVFAFVMLTGFRFHGRQRIGTGVAVGLAGGVLVGATSMGGPPVILYLMAGPGPLSVMRANLMLYVTMSSVAGLLALGLAGALKVDVMLLILALAPVYMLAGLAGGRIFHRINAQIFRRLTLIFLIGVSAAILVLS